VGHSPTFSKYAKKTPNPSCDQTKLPQEGKSEKRLLKIGKNIRKLPLKF